jgi:hypothetical protein
MRKSRSGARFSGRRTPAENGCRTHLNGLNKEQVSMRTADQARSDKTLEQAPGNRVRGRPRLAVSVVAFRKKRQPIIP